MSSKIPDEFMDLIAEKFRMLGEPTRLLILRALMAGEKNVGQLVEETGKTQANVSKHLKQLTNAGLVARRKEGLQVFYRLEDPVVEKVCHLVCETIFEEFEEQARRHEELKKRTERPKGNRR